MLAALLLSIAVLPLLIIGCTDKPVPHPRYSGIAAELTRLIEHEMAVKGIPSVAIALVEGQETRWSAAFGHSDREGQSPATVATVYRVGSVSKLFTDIAIMRLVERGEIQLDAPVTEVLPDFTPNNPYSRSITLRQLMSHRSGLVREPEVGSYFDPENPSLAETVSSLNKTTLVYEPETRIKYSNAAIAAVGYALEQHSGVPFTQYVKREVLDPIGMTNSGFEPDDAIRQNLAAANMWTYDGRVFPAPTFELGMSPAGSMYSPVGDLARFMKMLFNGGRIDGQQILGPGTLDSMWTPQFAEPGAATGFGIGFSLSRLDGHRKIGHGGAIYGFSTQLAMLPDMKLGVIVTCSMDVSNTIMSRISDRALELMLAVRNGEQIKPEEFTQPLDAGDADSIAGQWRSGDRRIELQARDGRLYMWDGTYKKEVRRLADTLMVDDRHAYGQKLSLIEPDQLRVGDVLYSRQPQGRPAPPPERWIGLIGEYGWDHNTLFILEKDGRLYALIEWIFLYPLEEIAADVFAFPGTYGLYHGENLYFTRQGFGRASRVKAGNVVFERRLADIESGATFKITPLQPVETLREAALAAAPPAEEGKRTPELVSILVADSSIALDVRYATTNNFMDAVFYDRGEAWMQRPAAEALARVHQRLRQSGYGLLVHDAYRPWYVTKMFWDATPENLKHFVANPQTGSIHNRGAAVDLNLLDLATGQPVEMVSGYDEFSPRSYPDYPGGTSLQRWHRELLRGAMEAEGFSVYQWEWWHYNHGEASEYPILNKTFDQLENAE